MIKDDGKKALPPDAKLDVIFQASPDLYFQLAPDGTILDYHAGRPADLSAPPEAFLGKRLQEVLPSEIGKRIHEAVIQAVESNDLVVLEYTLPLATGAQSFETRLLPLAGRQVVAMVRNVTGQKRTEEALRYENEFSESIINSLPGIFYLLDEEGRFIRWNRHFEEFTGYPPLRFLSIDLLELMAEADRERGAAAIQEVFRTGRSTAELRIIDAFGKFVPFFCTGSRLELDGHRYLAGMGIDISELKRMEGALRESEEKFSKVFHTAPVAITISTLADGRFIEANETCELFSGYRREELIGHTSLEFGIWGTSEERGRLIERVRKHGKVRDLEVTLKDKGDKAFVGLLSAVIIELNGQECLLTLVSDITARKRAEEALRMSEEKFSRAFRATPTILVISSLADGRYIEVNESFERTLGYCREEAIGRTSLELNMWENRADRERYTQILQEEGKVRNLDVKLRTKTGEVLMGLLSGEIIELNGKRCLLSLVNDITVRKRMEEEIEILHTGLACRAAELEAANQELEAFSFTVSHDLRSPLTGINGYSQLLLEQCTDNLDDRCRGYLHEINGAACRMDQLIGTMLNFARLSRSEITRETVNLSDMAHAIAAELSLQEPERRVNFTITDGVTAFGDARLLRVVLENLVGNAWKYTSRRDEAVIEFGVTEAEGKSTFFVRDNGTGFDMGQAERLFAPFHRLHGKEEFGGHGIGLATVQRIIQRHGGRVWAEAEVDKGATVYFTLQERQGGKLGA